MAGERARLALAAVLAGLAGFAAGTFAGGGTRGGPGKGRGEGPGDGRGDASTGGPRRGGAGPDAQSLRAGHEVSDLDGRLLQRLTLALLLVAGSMVAGMVGLRVEVQRLLKADRPVPTASELAPVDGPGPHLQTDPLGELAALRRAGEARVDGYGWNGPDHRQAHVPVARAMQMLTGQALMDGRGTR